MNPMNTNQADQKVNEMVSVPINKLLEGDCLDVLPQLPENSIDLIFADPPYNLQLQADLYRPNHTKVEAVTDVWDKFSSFEEYDRFSRQWLAACQRVLKKDGTIWVIGTYHNIFRLGTIIQDLGFWILNDVTWIKRNPMPNFRGVRFTNAHETLIWAQKSRDARHTFNHRTMKSLNDDLQMRSDWVLPLATGAERLQAKGKKAHSAQKPEALLYRVIMASSRPGDIVLDPFVGTGTTGAVAKRLGRNWIGIERDAKYIEAAQQRMDSIQTLPGEVLQIADGINQPRIPFGNLLETGLLAADEILWFSPNESITALILADGRIRCGDLVGSIHAVARTLLGAPCNGWDLWLYESKDKRHLPIDRLRTQLRQNIALGDSSVDQE